VITLESVSGDLAAGIERALPAWVEGHVLRLLDASGTPVDDKVRQQIDAAAAACVADIGPKVRRLLATDIDQQRTSPLAVARGAVVHPTTVLAGLGVPEVVRDEFAVANFPHDVYDLTPAAFTDLAPELHELGITWGAAKAHTHLQRRRAEES
jgi:hypothetical protein